MLLQQPQHWKGYELIDSGGFEKLERFGELTLIRPEPQAIWSPALSQKEWMRVADSRFVRDSSKSRQRTGVDDGWKHFRKTPQHWTVNYQHGRLDLKFKLSFTSFGHVGIFPEQANNWEFIANTVGNWKQPGKVLNLFAYTGGASLAAKAMGCDVTHVDAVRNMITWANENQELSGQQGIRWVVEDALKFAAKEAKRGKKYEGIILDPPAYGRGPTGEKWVLEEGLPELLSYCAEILSANHSFFILNLYSMGLSAVVSANLTQSHFRPDNLEYGEFVIPSAAGQQLPLGTFARFTRN
jgi:23S rRNA (cytosine1962-C5)-methyltransferase